MHTKDGAKLPDKDGEGAVGCRTAPGSSHTDMMGLTF